MRSYLSLLIGCWLFFIMPPVAAQTVPVQSGISVDTGWTNVRINCFDMQGIVQGLSRVTNEQQVYNNERSIWNNRNGCSSDQVRVPEVRSFLGWYDTGTFLVAIELNGFGDGTRPLFRPIVILRKSRQSLPPHCFSFWVTRRNITLFGNDGQPVPGCVPNVYPALPF